MKLFLILILTLSAYLSSQDYLDYPHPYHSTETTKGMVVSQNYLSSDIGAEILSKGGNAVDAAIAVGFSLTATLPRAGNIGGGGFMLVYDKKTESIISFDFRSMSPKLATPDVYKVNGVHQYELSEEGYKAIAVPGTVAGLIEAHEMFGTMDLADLVNPTIELLKEGVPVTDDLYWAINDTESLKKDPESKKIYLADEVIRGGKLFIEDLIKTMELIRDFGKAGFYDGENAERIEKAMIENGGLIRKNDLKEYKVNVGKPIATTYRGHTVFTQGPPSGGGVAVITALNVLENFNLSELSPNSGKYLHLLAEAMKLGHQSRSRYIGDPNFSNIPLEEIISKDLGVKKSKKINLKRASSMESINKWVTRLERNFKESKDTTHYSIIDESGNAVSVTYTLGFSFGSGVTIPGTGILTNSQMNNFAHDFGEIGSLRRGASPANKLEQYKRPMSTMCPILVFDNKNNLKLITGSPGGSKIPDINLQVVLNVIDFGLDIGAATMMPRIHQDYQSVEMDIEKFLNFDTRRILKIYGHKLEESDTIGSTQSILIDGDSKYGYADLRRPNAKVSVQK